jgi:hypothetical protein
MGASEVDRMSGSDASGVSLEKLGISWVTKLKPLTEATGGAITTLVAVGSNPEQWLRAHVFKLIAEWLVGQIIDAVQYVLGWVLFGIDRTVSIILDTAGPLASPFVILGDGIVNAIETLYGAVYGVAASAGLAAPLASAFAVAVLSAVLAALVYGLLRAIPGSDAIEGGLEALR